MTVAVQKVEKKDEKVEKRRALGRGLESLLPGPRVVAPAGAVPAVKDSDHKDTKTPHFVQDDKHIAVSAPREMEEVRTEPTQNAPGNQVVSLAIDLIDKNPYQTRYVFDDDMLGELRDSIKEHGVVQPIVVRPAEDGRYTLVLGERRLRASKMAGKDTIPALVRRVSPQQAAEMTVLENVVRADLSPLEQAEAFRVLSKEFHLTQAQIAERIGVSRETVSNYMRLLKLPEKVMKYMLDQQLTFSDARLILGLDNPEHIQTLADEVVGKHMKREEIEDRVMRLNGSLPPLAEQPASEKQAGSARWMDPNVRAAQTEMERSLGMRVRIKDRNGKGKIVIEYATVDDYERVVEMLRGSKN